MLVDDAALDGHDGLEHHLGFNDGLVPRRRHAQRGSGIAFGFDVEWEEVPRGPQVAEAKAPLGVGGLNLGTPSRSHGRTRHGRSVGEPDRPRDRPDLARDNDESDVNRLARADRHTVLPSARAVDVGHDVVRPVAHGQTR